MDGEFDSLGVQVVQLGLAVGRLCVPCLQPTGTKGVVHHIQGQPVNLPGLALRQLSRVVHIHCSSGSVTVRPSVKLTGSVADAAMEICL